MITRIFTFPARPQFLLVCASADQEIALPVLRSPFERVAVAEACGQIAGAGAIRVRDSEPGRFTATMRKALVDGRAERASQQQLSQAAEASFLRGSASAVVASRAEAMLEKQNVDEKIRILKARIATAKYAAFVRGVYMDKAAFRAMEEDLERAKLDSQGLQVRMSELREREKRERQQAQNTADQRFRQAARDILSPELFQEILDAAEEDSDGSDAMGRTG